MRVLTAIPSRGFDPTECAVPWDVLTRAGHAVHFATQDGAPGQADAHTLSGDGLPLWNRMLRVRPAERERYDRMLADPLYRAPTAWADVAPGDFDALVLPGGHAPSMRPYLESPDVQAIIRDFFRRDAPVAAICHGVLPVARTRDGERSVLYGRKTAALTKLQELSAWWMTRWWLGEHYRTYPKILQDEVVEALASPADFRAGGILPLFATESSPDAGFVSRDGNYLSARWPGDAHTWARALAALLDERAAAQPAGATKEARP